VIFDSYYKFLGRSDEILGILIPTIRIVGNIISGNEKQTEVSSQINFFIIKFLKGNHETQPS